MYNSDVTIKDRVILSKTFTDAHLTQIYKQTDKDEEQKQKDNLGDTD